jgi:hypothetical protein
MQVGEAIVLGASARPEGVQELVCKTVCPDAGFERLNVVTPANRAAAPLDRPERGALRHFKAVLETDAPVQPGQKVVVESFYPGEQAGAH